MTLPKRAIFGDYAVLFNLKSNIIFTAGESNDEQNEIAYDIDGEV